jgi:hypothetical protein
MIKIEDGLSKVYIICPANVATGGPELLHQMAFQLNAMHIKAYIFYLPNHIENPVHPYYEHYNIPFVKHVDNTSQHIVIVPEALANVIYDKRFSKMQKVIWWLSVDNYFAFIEDLVKRHQHKKTFKIKQLFNYYNIPTINHIARQKKLFHLVQSEYARDFLKKNKITNIAYLSDYLGQAFFNKIGLLKEKKRGNTVLYNPKKGLKFTEEIIKRASHINFIPIQNLTPEEVSNLLSISKVYIDFGNHPGKDRFPREAAISGCCILTNKRGSANFYEDVPIEEEFKFVDQEENIPNIITKIEACLNDFEQESTKFEPYRNWITNEQQQFNEDLRNIFKKSS